jgi:SnoaL-like domain
VQGDAVIAARVQPTVEEERRCPPRTGRERGGGVVPHPLPEVVPLEVAAQALLVEPDLTRVGEQVVLVELSDLYFDGDVVVVQLSLNGTHQGDLPTALGTIPATGKEFHAPCCDVFHLEDGKVSAFDCYYAGTILVGQIGVLGNLDASLKK